MIAETLLRNKTVAGLAAALTLCLLTPLASTQAFAQKLEVISILPQGRVERITQVVVRFNQAMVPLGAEPGSSPPLEIRPLPKGRYRWLDTHTLSYILDRPLSGASRLLIKVPAGARSLSGAVLAKTKKAQAFTPEIAAVRILPQPKYPLGPRPEIKLVLNQPVDLQSLAQRIWFIAGGKRFPAEVSQGQLPRWERRLPHLARLYLLRCPGELPLGQKVTLRVEPGVIPAQGDIPLKRPIEVRYPAYKTLALIKHQMPRALTGGLDPTASLLLQFNNPVTAKQVWEHLEIHPALPPPEDDLSTYPSRWVHLALKFEPRRTYRVVLKSGPKDVYETTMTQARSFELRMGDLDPRLHLPKGQGVLEAVARPLLPLRFRNLQKMQVGLRFYEPDQVVPALVAESERPWNKPAPAPKADEAGAVSQQVTLEAPPNRIAVHNLDLADLLQRSPQGGLTLVDIRASWLDPKGKMKKRVRRSLVQVTDLGLSLKLGQASGVAWVTQLSTGRPRSDVALELRDRRNRILWQGRSGQNGVAAIPDLKSLAPAKDEKRSWRNPVVYLLAQVDEDFAVLPSEWSDELLFSLTGKMVRTRPGRAPTMAAHTVFQLPLYQPAQTVRFLVLLRTLGPQGPAVPSTRQVEAWIEDPYGNKVYDFKGSSDDFGTLSGSFKLSPACRLGRFNLFVKTEGQTLPAGSFRVASFRPPDFKVELTPPPEQVGAVPQGPALLQARYMFGTPLAGAKAEVVVRQLRDHFSLSKLKGYVVGPVPLPGDEPRPARKLATLEASLDAEGKTSLTLPPAQLMAGLPLSLSLEAQVKDPSQRAVSARARVRVHPAEIYLGIKTPLLTTVGAPAKISLAAATWDDRPATAGPVKVTAFRQYWETVREKGPGGFYRYLGRARREKVWETSLDMEKDQADTEFTPSQSGTYVIVAEAQDQKGRLARSGTYLWVSGQGVSGWRRFDDHRLEMVASDKQVKAGQSLRLMLKNPFAQATALITVERLGVRRTLVRRVEGPAPVVEVPLGQDDAPGVYVGVLLVRGRMGSPRPGGPDLGRPQMRIGYAAVKVEGPDPGLEVEVKPRQLKVRPGAQVEVDLALTRQGKPASGQATILAVDERVLSAAGGRTSYDPRPAFARLQPLAILNADSRTEVIGRVLSALKGESPAGGGGAGPSLRQKFHPAVFWLAQARTGPQGKYTARFSLPDSLTSYRVVAVAADKKGGLGLGQANIIASQPLQLLSALPRFASTGDIFNASVLVQNLGEKPGTISARAQTQGLTLTGPDQAEITLAPGETRAVGFMVKAGSPGKASVTVEAEMGAFTDAARFTLPVLPLTQLQTQATAGVTKATPEGQSREIALRLPGDAQPGRGGLKLNLSPSLASRLARPAEMLLGYPWDCLEQQISRSAARALRITQGWLLGLPGGSDDRRHLAALQGMMADFQTPGGGFTFWPRSGRADTFLTAYVLVAAAQMKEAGFIPPQGMLKSATDYLERHLRRAKAPRATDLGARITECMVIWALTLQGRETGSYLENALGRLQGLSPFGLAALMQAAGALGQKTIMNTLVTQLETTAEVSAEHLHFAAIDPGGFKAVMGSTLRGNALALWALSRFQPEYPRLDALARWVARELGSRPMLSTQDAVFGLWGLAAFLAPAESRLDLEADVVLDGRRLLKHRFEEITNPPVTVEVVRNLLDAGRDQKLRLSAAGSGRLYWSARLSYAPGSPPQEPVNAGLTLSRFFQSPEGSGQGPWRLGQEVEQVITLATPHTRHHVLVRVPYPAGLEPAYPISGPKDWSGPWQWREQRRSELVLYSPRLRPGVYTHRLRLRAIARGTFNLRPGQAEEMYAPEVFGATAAEKIEVK